MQFIRIWVELEKQSVVVPETYVERKGHHEAEIAGLKEAFSIPSEGEVLVQQKSRGTFLHTAFCCLKVCAHVSQSPMTMDPMTRMKK